MMAWHAISMLEDALEATKKLLFPLMVKRWVVLGIVAFFVSGTTGFNLGYNVTLPDLSFPLAAPAPWSPETAVPIQEFPTETVIATPSVIEVLLGLFVIGFVVVIGLVVFFIAAIMEFVFVKIATTTDVRIRGFFGASTEKGTALFFFRLGILVLVLGSFAMVAILTLLTGGLFLVVLVLLAPVLFAMVILLWVVLRFTTDFVVPIMLADDTGVIEGWRAFWTPLTTDWKQYGAYAVIRFILGVAASIAIGIATAAFAIVLLIPFGLVGLVGFLLFSLVAETAAIVFLVGLVMTFVVVLLAAVMVFVQVPVQTYLRYYGLFVLGAITPEYDLVSDHRT